MVSLVTEKIIVFCPVVVTYKSIIQLVNEKRRVIGCIESAQWPTITSRHFSSLNLSFIDHTEWIYNMNKRIHFQLVQRTQYCDCSVYFEPKQKGQHKLYMTFYSAHSNQHVMTMAVNMCWLRISFSLSDVFIVMIVVFIAIKITVIIEDGLC